MSIRVAFLAETVRMARVLAPGASAGRREIELVPFSLASYLRAAAPPPRVVLCPPGKTVAGDLDFLRRVAARLLWPVPAAGVAEAIGGLRGDEPAPPPKGTRRPGARRRGPALLLEGSVDAARVRAALRGSRTRDWIAESAVRVRLTPRALVRLARKGVRWSVLQPVAVDFVYATPELARVRPAWRGLLTPRARVRIRTQRAETLSRRGPG